MIADFAGTVSVVIINYNDEESLRQCVTSALELDWPQLDVIVVDNASSDSSPDMVAAEFGQRVRLIRRHENSPTAGRNEGFKAAKGNYILSLDNDILMVDRATIRKAIPIFQQFPNVAVLSFNVGTVENSREPLPEHWWHPVPIAEAKNRFFYTDYFSEGAVFFRKEAILSAGGYDELMFQYYECIDLTLKLLRDGYDMLFCPNLFCGELRVRGFLNQRRVRQNYLELRNKIWMVWKYYPLSRGFPYLVGRVSVSGYRSVRHGWFDYFLKGVKEGIFAPRAIRAQRRPLQQQVWQKINQIHRGIFWDLEANGEIRPCPR
jgi:glycosyltransferase involved in cell wall biosynthesis